MQMQRALPWLLADVVLGAMTALKPSQMQERKVISNYPEGVWMQRAIYLLCALCALVPAASAFAQDHSVILLSE